MINGSPKSILHPLNKATETAPSTALQQHQQRPTMYAHAAGPKALSKQTSLQKAVRKEKSRKSSPSEELNIAANNLAVLTARSNDVFFYLDILRLV